MCVFACVCLCVPMCCGFVVFKLFEHNALVSGYSNKMKNQIENCLKWSGLFIKIINNFPSHCGQFYLFPFQFTQKANVHKAIESALKKGFTATTRGVGDGPCVLLDTVSLLRKVISPSLRTVSVELLSPK